jgi:hypothetical protein
LSINSAYPKVLISFHNNIINPSSPHLVSPAKGVVFLPNNADQQYSNIDSLFYSSFKRFVQASELVGYYGPHIPAAFSLDQIRSFSICMLISESLVSNIVVLMKGRTPQKRLERGRYRKPIRVKA